MNTLELKSILHKLIVETDDVNILNSIQDYFQALKSDIPTTQQEEVRSRIEAIEKGEMKTRDWDEAKNDILG